MEQQFFPPYFTELYLKLPFPIITYWNDEDDCQMMDIGEYDSFFLRTHADTFEDGMKMAKELLTLDMEVRILSDNIWPIHFGESKNLFKDLQQNMEALGYDEIIRFIEEEKLVVRTSFYNYFDRFQKGVL